MYDRIHKLIFGDLEYRLYRLNQYNIETARLHEKTFGPYKNKHNGEDIVIVACGPSAQNFKYIPNAKYIAINRATRLNIDFDYLFLEDGGATLKDFNNEMDAYRPGNCKKFYGTQAPGKIAQGNVIPESSVIKTGASRYHTDSFAKFRGFEPEFAFDLSTRPLGAFGTTALSALQFALWTNPRRIYLVGCDCTATGHFYSKSDTSNLNISSLLKGYKAAKFFAEHFYPDTEIISVNPVGLRGLFKDWDQDKGPLE